MVRLTAFSQVLVYDFPYLDNWAQLSNEYRANEQAGDRAELSGHQVVWQKCSKSIYIGIIYINGYVTNAGQRTNKQEKIGQLSL